MTGKQQVSQQMSIARLKGISLRAVATVPLQIVAHGCEATTTAGLQLLALETSILPLKPPIFTLVLAQKPVDDMQSDNIMVGTTATSEQSEQEGSSSLVFAFTFNLFLSLLGLAFNIEDSGRGGWSRVQ